MKEKFKKWLDDVGWILFPILIIVVLTGTIACKYFFHDCYTTRYEIIDKIQYDDTYGTHTRTSTNHRYKLILKDAQNHISEKNVGVETWYNFDVGDSVLFGCEVCGKVDRNNVR